MAYHIKSGVHPAARRCQKYSLHDLSAVAYTSCTGEYVSTLPLYSIPECSRVENIKCTMQTTQLRNSWGV